MSVLAPWVVETAIITYRELKGTKDQPIPHLPVPSRYTSTFIIYGALGLVSGQAAPVAALVGWGLVVATLLNLWTPGGGVKAPATTTSATTTSGKVPA